MQEPNPSVSAADDDRVAEVLDAYLEQQEQGTAVSQTEFLAAHPDMAEKLRRCLQSLDFMQHASVGLQAPRDAQPLINRTLGDFRLLRELGRGGMGVVYEAEQLSLGRPVALKVLPYAALLDSRQLERFKNEARAAAMLKHPHIVSVHSVGCERSVHFYAMELIRGRSLEKVIGALRRSEQESTESSAEERRGVDDAVLPRALNRRSEEASPGEGTPGADTAAVAELSTQRQSDRKGYYRSVAELGVQAAEALDYAHGEGVLHRDVKPSNLLFDERGRLHVADFGLARVHSSNETLTLTGDVLGTLRYMSPEQAEGRYVDHRTDVYSLGATLYELAVLHPAIDGKDRRELLRRLADSETTPPHEVDPRIPRDLETILLQAMAPAAEDRYETALALADDLRRFLAAEPVRAQRPGPWRHFVRWVGRNRAISGLVAALLLVLTTLAVAGPVVAVHAKRLATNEAEARTRAESHQSDLQRLLTETLAETIVALENTANVDVLLENLLQQAAAQFDSLMSSDDLTPEQRRDLAKWYTQLGRVVQFRFADDSSEAMVRKAANELESLRQALPNDPSLMFALASAYSFLGKHNNDAELARRSVSAAEELVRLEPDVVDHQGMLLWSRTFLAEITMRRQEPGAEQELLAARGAWSDLARAHPGNPNPLGGVAYAKWMLGRHYFNDGRPGLAEVQYREAAGMPLEGIDMEGRFRVGYGHVRARWGETLLRLRRPAEAEAILREGVAHLRQTYQDFPRSGWARGAYHQGRNALSDALREQGRLEEAVAVIQHQPNNQGEYRLGLLKFAQGELANARMHFAAAIGELETTADHAEDYQRLAYYFATCPDVKFRDAEKSSHYAQQGNSMAARRDWRLQGIVLYRKERWPEAAEAFAKGMQQKHGGDAADCFWLALTWRRLGGADAAAKWLHLGRDQFDRPLVGGGVETGWGLDHLREEAEREFRRSDAVSESRIANNREQLTESVSQ